MKTFLSLLLALAISVPALSAEVTGSAVSTLPAASALTGTEVAPIVQGSGPGSTKKVTANQIKTFVRDGLAKGDVGLGNVDNTSDATKNAAAATLTNKQISGGQITSAVATATSATSAGTAAALSANGTNCSPGDAARGVDASGNAEGCFTPGAVGGSTLFKVATTSRQSDATPSADPDLAYTGLAAGTYRVTAYLLYQTNDTAGFKASLLASQSLFDSWITYVVVTQTLGSTSVAITENPRTAATGTPLTVDGGNANAAMLSGFLILPSSTNVSIQWSQNTGTAVNTSLLAGSWLKIEKIS